MSDQERITKLKEAFADQEFAKKMLEMETAEEVQQALKGKGVDLSAKEIQEIQKQIIRQAETGEELEKEQLKNVAGGFVVTAAMATMAAAGALLQTGLLVNQVTRRRW